MHNPGHSLQECFSYTPKRFAVRPKVAGMRGKLLRNRNKLVKLPRSSRTKKNVRDTHDLPNIWMSKKRKTPIYLESSPSPVLSFLLLLLEANLLSSLLALLILHFLSLKLLRPAIRKASFKKTNLLHFTQIHALHQNSASKKKKKKNSNEWHATDKTQLYLQSTILNN